MKQTAKCLGVLLIGFAAFHVNAQAVPAKPPTQAEIQKMIEAKAYRPAVRAIAQVMPMAMGPAARDYDKYTLLMMRGECMLQLKDAYSANLAYEQAAGTAAALPQQETAQAASLLVRRSPGLVYTSRTGEKAKFELADAGARHQATAALLADELPPVNKQIDDALKAKTLQPIFALAPALRELHAIEMAASGDDKQTIALARSLGDRISDLMNAELTRVNEQLQAIERSANRVVIDGGGNFQTINGAIQWVPEQGSTGLTTDQRQTLRDAVIYLNRINDTCEQLYKMARRYELDGNRWRDLGTKVCGRRDFAQAVYDHE